MRESALVLVLAAVAVLCVGSWCATASLAAGGEDSAATAAPSLQERRMMQVLMR